MLYRVLRIHELDDECSVRGRSVGGGPGNVLFQRRRVQDKRRERRELGCYPWWHSDASGADAAGSYPADADAPRGPHPTSRNSNAVAHWRWHAGAHARRQCAGRSVCGVEHLARTRWYGMGFEQ